MSDNCHEPIQALTRPRLIVCEGQGDQAFFRHLIAARRLPEFEIHFPRSPYITTGGWQGFGGMLTALRAVAGFKRLQGIVVVSDNDEDPNSQFIRVAEQIASADGYEAPQRPLAVARADNIPPLVVMMLPWEGEPGTLETLCLRSAYDERPSIRTCLDAFVDCTGVNAWRLTKQLKMRMRCLLSASCEADPNTSLVHAWSGEGRGSLIPLDHECFNQVATFLQGFDDYLAGH